MTEKKPEDPDRDRTSGAAAAKEYLPPLDFSSIVLPFYTQALITLGILEDPADPAREKNLELARRLIDLIELLKDRTKGNLRAEEEKFLETCLQQLRLGYLEQAKIIR
jgi:hypothetical protein